MSNNTPNYNDNLAFDHDANTMPRCDIEELKREIKHLKDLLVECTTWLNLAQILTNNPENETVIKNIVERILDCTNES